MRICQSCKKLKSHGQYSSTKANICNTCKSYERLRVGARHDTKISLGPPRDPPKINADYVCPEVD